MLNLNAPEFGHRELTDYGCAGRNLLDPFHSNIGMPVDLTDKALSRWKTCIRCAKEPFIKNRSEKRFFLFVFNYF
jgi:hypothetical protein